VIATYQEPDSYRQKFCNRKCDDCQLDLTLEDGEEINATGIEMLLADSEETISLTPLDTLRMERRDEH